VHGPLVASEETEAVLAFVREQAEPAYIAAAIEALDAAAEGECAAAPGPAGDGLYERAVALVVRDCRASVGVLGRRLGIGRANAADLIARMQDEGIIGPADASGWHDVLGPAAAGRAAAAH
jgi:S-DNA-T family DNA segregation ATPase FtsK/SpoIIIE